MSEKAPLAAEKVAQIRKEFDYFDTNSSGEIGLREFIELLTILSPKTKASHVKEGFGLIDKNNDGSIDFDEFLEWWQQSWWEY
jgi:Ca2+-binding EF-hand superfamily protein